MIWDLIKRPWLVVLILGILSGVTLSLIVPPMMAADEGAHFFRAYEVSEGRVLSRHDVDGSSCGQFLPSSLVEIVRLVGNMPFNPGVKFKPSTLLTAAKVPLDPENRSFLKFTNTALYSPVAYVPQALGFAIGRALGAGPLLISYAGRILNLLISVGIMSLAVYLIPVQKWALAILSLLPMTIFQCASLSADGITISVSLLFIALVLRAALLNQGDIRSTEVLPIVATGVILSLTKSSYTPMLALVALVPGSRFKRPWIGRLAFIGATVSFGLLVAGAWTVIVQAIYVPANTGINPREQLHWILAHPLGFIQVLRTTVDSQTFWVTVSAFGRLLGWFDTVLPYSVLSPLFVLLPLAAMTDLGSSLRVAWSQRIISLLIWIGTTLLITVMMYLSWTPIGAGSVEGLQGRYFLPIMPLILLPLALGNHRAFAKGSKLLSGLYAGCALYSVSVTIFLVANRYYGA